MKPTWSFVPLMSFLAFLLGGIVWIALKLFGVEPSFIADIPGGLAALGFIGVVYHFLLGAPYHLWEKDAPLRELRDTQKQQVRSCIHPILVNVDWDLPHLDRVNWGNIRIRLAFVSLLLHEQVINRLQGELSFSTDNENWSKVTIPDFKNVERRLFPLTISNSFSQDVAIISEQVKGDVRQLWKDHRRTPAVYLTLVMERPDGDPIQFDPSPDFPLSLRVQSEEIKPIEPNPVNEVKS
jgi:hypothetical protein